MECQEACPVACPAVCPPCRKYKWFNANGCADSFLIQKMSENLKIRMLSHAMDYIAGLFEYLL